MSTTSLPVLMYHYISTCPGSISVPPETFEEHCRGMAESGWHGVSLEEAQDYFIEGKPLPDKSVLITFDDGYLDNYLFAWPLLKRYGHKGVIFAVTNRIEDSPRVRPTLNEVWSGELSMEELVSAHDRPMKRHQLGYVYRKDAHFSWTEAKLMEQSGIMRIAGHSASHLAVFAGREYNGFYRPRGKSRTFDIVDEEVPWGLPRFKERPLLYSRAMRPTPLLLDAVRSMVPQEKEAAWKFFQNKENVERLEKFFWDIGQDNWLIADSDQQRTERMRKDIVNCKEALEQNLGHRVSTFCWPWGGYCAEALDLALDCGFKMFFTTKYGANPPGFPLQIRRFKVKNCSWTWLRSRLFIYSSPMLASCYAKIHR